MGEEYTDSEVYMYTRQCEKMSKLNDMYENAIMKPSILYAKILKIVKKVSMYLR